MQLPSRKARVALLAGCATLGLAGTANASSADYKTATDTLEVTVTGDATSDVITCVGGQVQFNGAAPSRDGVFADPTGCGASVALTVNEPDKDTATTNTVDLRGITRAEWTALASSTITMGGGSDTVFGTEIADTITPAKGDDTVNGHDGNDVMIWNPGEATDRMTGDAGVDTVVDNGAAVDETFEIKPGAADPSRVDVTRTIPAAGLFNLDVSAEKVIVNGNDGNDTVNGFTGLADLIKAEINGGNGTDILTGTDANDTLDGGEGTDNIRGLKGNDTMRGGGGDDVLTWDPGEGSDIFEGGDGNDVGVDNGGAGAEHFIVSAQGEARSTVTRDNAAPFFLDMGTIETLDLNTNGGDDSVDVNAGLGTRIKVDANLGDGNDSIRSRNDSAEVIDGAGGTDTATVDATDQVTNVESVDTGAPTGKAKKVTFKSKRLKVKGGRATMKITCPAGGGDCNGRAAILVKGKVVGSKAFKLQASQTKTLRIPLKRKTRIKLAKDADKKLAATARVRIKSDGKTLTSKKKLKLVAA